MDLRPYLNLVADKIEEASNAGNVDEATRLLGLIRDVAVEQIAKLQPPGLGVNAGDQMVPPEVIQLPDHYYILGDSNLYARHLFRRDGEKVKLVAIIIDAEAGERIANALQEG